MEDPGTTGAGLEGAGTTGVYMEVFPSSVQEVEAVSAWTEVGTAGMVELGAMEGTGSC